LRRKQRAFSKKKLVKEKFQGANAKHRSTSESNPGEVDSRQGQVGEQTVTNFVRCPEMKSAVVIWIL
jgi:hypothetical protein